MALIDKTYFQNGLTAIPNLSNANNGATLDDLNSYISEYEDVYLDDVLGIDLKDEFIAGLAESVVDQKWTDLLNGKKFEYNGTTYTWKGFNNTIKKSPVANYVFFFFAREHTSLFTGIGTTTSKAENSNVISPYIKLVDNWNKMVSFNRVLELYLLAFPDDYSSYCPNDVLTEQINYYGI